MAEMGVEPIGYADLVSAGAAIVIALMAWGAGVLAGRRAGPFFARLWERYAGARKEGVADRMCAIVRYVVAALILGIAIVSEPWPDLPKADPGPQPEPARQPGEPGR